MQKKSECSIVDLTLLDSSDDSDDLPTIHHDKSPVLKERLLQLQAQAAELLNTVDAMLLYASTLTSLGQSITRRPYPSALPCSSFVQSPQKFSLIPTSQLLHGLGKLRARIKTEHKFLQRMASAAGDAYLLVTALATSNLPHLQAVVDLIGAEKNVSAVFLTISPLPPSDLKLVPSPTNSTPQPPLLSTDPPMLQRQSHNLTSGHPDPAIPVLGDDQQDGTADVTDTEPFERDPEAVDENGSFSSSGCDITSSDAELSLHTAPVFVDVVSDAGQRWIKVKASSAHSLARLTCPGSTRHGQRGLLQQARAMQRCAQSCPLRFTIPSVVFYFQATTLPATLRAQLTNLGVIVQHPADKLSNSNPTEVRGTGINTAHDAETSEITSSENVLSRAGTTPVHHTHYTTQHTTYKCRRGRRTKFRTHRRVRWRERQREKARFTLMRVRASIWM